MAEPARRLWTLEEFLAFDDGTDTRYELFDGQIFAMAPASDVHGALVMRLARQIGNALRSGYEVIAGAGIVLRSAPTAGTRPTSRSPAPGLRGGSSSPSRS